MKKIISRSLLLLAAAIAAPLCGCSAHHNGKAKMSDIVGIYKLTERTETLPDETRIDAIAAEQLTAYFLIDGSEFGYAYYKDPTKEIVSSVYVRYNVNEEASNIFSTKYSDIDIDWGLGLQRHPEKGYHPGYKEPTFGIWEKSHTLEYQQLRESRFNDINHSYTAYKRISTEKTFEKFKQLAGFSLEKPANFLTRNAVNKDFVGNSGDIQTQISGIDGIKIVSNSDFTKVSFKSLPTGLADEDSNYVSTNEFSISKFEKKNMDDNPNMIGYYFTVNGDTPLGNNPRLVLAEEYSNNSYPQIWYEINGTRLIFC